MSIPQQALLALPGTACGHSTVLCSLPMYILVHRRHISSKQKVKLLQIDSTLAPRHQIAMCSCCLKLTSLSLGAKCLRGSMQILSVWCIGRTALIRFISVCRSTVLGSYWPPELALQQLRPPRTPCASASFQSSSPRTRPQPWPSTTAPSTWAAPCPLLLSLWRASWASSIPNWASPWYALCHMLHKESKRRIMLFLLLGFLTWRQFPAGAVRCF